MQTSVSSSHRGRLFRSRLILRTALRALGTCFLLVGSGASVLAVHEVLVVKGHSGQAAFGAEIDATAKLWQEAAAKAGHTFTLIAPASSPAGEAAVPAADVGGTVRVVSGVAPIAPIAGETHAAQPKQVPSAPSGADADTQLERFFAALKGVKAESPDPLWLVLLGHGSAQGRMPKFNLEGPDLNSDALALQLLNLRRPVIVVAGFSASGAFLKPLAGPGRIIIAATRSGTEENWTRFPRYFASALSNLDADADADGQVSLMEAWRHATRAVEASYKEQGRLCTEHSALEDVGDGRASSKNHGQKARQWHLIQSTVEAGLTPLQRERREEIEGRIARLRERKNFAAPAEYAAELEALLGELVGVYEGQ